MRKSNKRVIAIITCCFVLATFCVGVFADENTQEDINPDMNRIGTVLNTAPYDLGDVVCDFSQNASYIPDTGYYILKINYNKQLISNVSISVYSQEGPYFVNMTSAQLFIKYYYNFISNSYDYIFRYSDTYYVYVYINNPNHYQLIVNGSINDDNSIKLYSIANRSVIDSVYSNSQDVNSSIVSVINEATNVITTNDVIMMFCILIPVISFGVGILIRLRKRA